MDIKRLIEIFEGVARLDERGPHGHRLMLGTDDIADAKDLAIELREMLEHQQGEADRAKAGLAVNTVGVIHALEIGIEETRIAHVTVEQGRQDAERSINAAMARITDERSKVADAVLHSCMQQINTIPEVRALARGEALDGTPLRGNQAEGVLRRLAENIANNVAVYVTIPEQCEVCGQISAGNTCCPPESHHACVYPGCGLSDCTAAREAKGGR
jgi:hypothetical protein